MLRDDARSTPDAHIQLPLSIVALWATIAPCVSALSPSRSLFSRLFQQQTMSLHGKLGDVEAGQGLAGGFSPALQAEPMSRLPGLVLPIAIAMLIILVTLRINIVLRRSKAPHRPQGTSTHLMIVLGSGGHTAEMFSILRKLDTSKYTHRTYIVSSGDNFSSDLAQKCEARLNKREEELDLKQSSGRVIAVPRARKIHQSLLTAPFSCLRCLQVCLQVLPLPWPLPDLDVMSEKDWQELMERTPKTGLPDAILTNGPATSVIVVVASYILRFLGYTGSRHRLRVVYVESWARVKKLSLSGKIMLRLADRFLVQWESLKSATGGKGEYIGVLVE